MDWCGECFFRKRPTTRITGLQLEELLIFSLLGRPASKTEMLHPVTATAGRSTSASLLGTRDARCNFLSTVAQTLFASARAPWWVSGSALVTPLARGTRAGARAKSQWSLCYRSPSSSSDSLRNLSDYSPRTPSSPRARRRTCTGTSPSSPSWRSSAPSRAPSTAPGSPIPSSS